MTNKEIAVEGAKYLLNTYKRPEVAFVKGQGARLWDADGKEYIDFLAGIAVNSLGCNYSKLVETIGEQCSKIMHSSNLYWIEPQVELAKLLCENSFGDKVFFCNSGTEANEAAIKTARKYSIRKYGLHRCEIISMLNSFHGRTLGALAATGQEKYHQSFLPMVPGFKFGKFNDIESIKSLVNENVCAIIMEPVQGEGGINPAKVEFVQALKQICEENDILLIFDEVQCGVGRTGTLFAYEQLGVVPDIMTLAKGLAGGVPIGAMVVNKKLSNVLVPGDHGSTFGGNHLACSAGCMVLKEIKDVLLKKVKSSSEYFFKKLHEMKEELTSIEFITGMGLMIGVKLNVDSGVVSERCLQKGLVINSLGNNMLRIVPPLVINEEDIDEGLDILKSVLLEVQG